MKYIIDVPASFVDITKGLHIPVDKLGNSRIDTGLKVTRYTEPDRKTIENEVWEYAWKMFLTPDDFGATMGDSYAEAKAKYEAWLKQKDEIRVGDEVILYDHVKMIVTQEDHGTSIQGVDENGECYECIECNAVKKTGRHFDEVEELLKKIGE